MTQQNNDIDLTLGTPGRDYVEEAQEKHELPQLTDKQLEFAIGLARGVSQAEAYRQAYNGTNGTALVEGCRLAADPRINLMVRALREQAIENGIVSLASHIAELELLKNEARQAKQFGPATTAEKARGQVMGYYVDRHVHEFKTDDKQLIKQIRETFGEQAAKEALIKLGYPTETIEGEAKEE